MNLDKASKPTCIKRLQELMLNFPHISLDEWQRWTNATKVWLKSKSIDSESFQANAEAVLFQLRMIQWATEHEQERDVRNALEAGTRYLIPFLEQSLQEWSDTFVWPSNDKNKSETAKQKRNDWLLEQRGLDAIPKKTEKQLSDMLLKKCETETQWVHIEAKTISTALREAYSRQNNGAPWPFDGRGKGGKTPKR